MPSEIQTPVVQEQAASSGLDTWRSQLDRLEAEVENFAGTAHYPEWWSGEDDSRDIFTAKELRAEGEIDVEAVQRFYQLTSREQELQKIIRATRAYGHPFIKATDVLTPDFMGKAMAQEASDGMLHAALLEDLQRHIDDNDGLAYELETLAAAYGKESRADLFSIKDDEFGARLQPLLRTPLFIQSMIYEETDHKDATSDAERQKETLSWVSKAIVANTGLDKLEANTYAFSVSRRGETEAISRLLEVTNHFGASRLRDITRATGIVGIENYTIEQLERMEKFANDPEAVGQDLANHDVTVALVNRVGDHNGVLSSLPGAIDDEAKRTVFFEINRLADIYRYMGKLHKAGIRPSTMILAAHSAPGQFIVADKRGPEPRKLDAARIAGRRLVAVQNVDGSLNPSEFGYSMHGMKGMARLADDYMQPSRGADDSEADKGRKKIIFWACSAGTEMDMYDGETTAEQEKIGFESVVSQLGNDLLSEGATSTVDIYGASNTIQMEATTSGIEFTVAQGMGQKRLGIAAERISLNNGKLTHDQVREIALRKSA